MTDAPSQFAYDDPESVFEEMADRNPLYAGVSYEGIERSGRRWPFSSDPTPAEAAAADDPFETDEKRSLLRSRR